ncbi:transposase [Sporomusaceae bacterium BoRhaA]|uniref:IS1634 family transposase n=1 Tax=Pelorhabdus rhamnosifermentans TaxID=2772457 RepID=UPI001C060F55|nr:IS1634 family transposase [Pelorhabdus rhamnosifermentans]MBU2703214.1 transposase [Pelorhabdus rhamnosifermentans]
MSRGKSKGCFATFVERKSPALYTALKMHDRSSHSTGKKRLKYLCSTLIGRLDAATGEIVPTDGRGHKKTEPAVQPKQGPIPISHTDRRFFGATYLFDRISEKIGVTADLKQCFPKDYKKILSIVYYLIFEDANLLCRFGRWSRIHRHPFSTDITSQRSSELFASVTEEAKSQFFCLQGKRRVEKEFWAYDSTSISSYSEHLQQVRYGKNKDYDPLHQINLALLFGKKSNLPFYYRKLAGNIPNVKTVRELVKELNILGYERIKLVMDRGFYSAGNINELFKNHYKFIVSASTALSYAKAAIKKQGTLMRSWQNYSEKYELYYYSESIAWDYTQERLYKGDAIKGSKRMYLHFYYNPEKAIEDGKNFNRYMSKLQNELLTGKHFSEHEAAYKKYFETKETPIRGIQIAPRQGAMDEARSRCGCFLLLSNEVKDAIPTLELYRNRDVVEKAFGNLKERLNGRRTLVSSNQSPEGKLFVEFIALIYLSYIKKKMEEKDLFKKYTLQSLLDELDVIECYEEPGKAVIVGEILRKQVQIYEDLGVGAPVDETSLD